MKTSYSGGVIDATTNRGPVGKVQDDHLLNGVRVKMAEQSQTEWVRRLRYGTNAMMMISEAGDQRKGNWRSELHKYEALDGGIAERVLCGE